MIFFFFFFFFGSIYNLFSLPFDSFTISIKALRTVFAFLVLITTAQLPSIKSELSFCTGTNPAHSMLEIRNGQDL